MVRNWDSLIEHLYSAYAARFPHSATLDRRARQVMVDGGSHNVRLNRPFPLRITAASGASLIDADGHTLLDFWQGHFANLLGNNPPIVAEALAADLASGCGLQMGMTDELAVETAELLCERLHAERLRFTTSGTLATMYAVMLARAFTGRRRVVKVAAGWHGAQPWGLKGVYFHPGEEPWGLESEGLPAHIGEEVIVSRFNDEEHLEGQFREQGDQIAVLLVEPFAGAGNFIAAKPDYLTRARHLCDHYGALLVFDEVITAFRFCAGDLGALYGVRPDLVTVGKIAGGGMPLAAVGGRADVMCLCGREGGSRVAFSGGTYSAHPTCLRAAKTMIPYLVAHEDEVYPRLSRHGDLLRTAIEEGFAAEGIEARCSGQPDGGMSGSSLAGVHFPYDADTVLERPDTCCDPMRCDAVMKHQVFQLALMLEGVYTLYGGCALSTVHSKTDIDRLREACRSAAQLIKKYL